MKGNLTFIHLNFTCLPKNITRLQKQVFPISKAIEIIQDILAKCSQFSGTTRTAIN